MSPAADRPVDLVGWLWRPLAAALLASLLFAAPARLFGLPLPEPVFAFAPAFAWAIIRPSLVAPLSLLILGLALDLLWRAPLGFWPTCLMTVYAAGLFGGSFLAGQAFVVAWVGYAAACAAAFLVALVITYIRSATLADPLAVLWQWLVTAALFPFAWRLMRRYEGADARNL